MRMCKLTGAEEVPVETLSQTDERFGTLLLLDQNPLCSVFACGFRGGEDQQIAEDTDVDQRPLRGFHSV